MKEKHSGVFFIVLIASVLIVILLVVFFAKRDLDEVQETLAVGLFVKGLVPVHRPPAFLVFNGLGGDIVKALCPQEESPVLVTDTLADCDGIAELRIVIVGVEPIIQ